MENGLSDGRTYLPDMTSLAARSWPQNATKYSCGYLHTTGSFVRRSFVRLSQSEAVVYLENGSPDFTRSFTPDMMSLLLPV